MADPKPPKNVYTMDYDFETCEPDDRSKNLALTDCDLTIDGMWITWRDAEKIHRWLGEALAWRKKVRGR